MNSRYPEQIRESLRMLIGRTADTVIDRQEVWNLRLPSGELTNPTETEQRKTFPLANSSAARFGDIRTAFLEHNPGGISEIDPAAVVSPQPVSKYEVLPEQAGLLQLMLDGILSRNRGGEFLIHKAMRFPAGLSGSLKKFVLLKGVPLPSGDPGHAIVISEETGESLCQNGVCKGRP
jgi:hypothetical protein